MVFPGVAFADGGLHETGEGWQYVDGWVDTFVVELSVNEDLAFSDVACKIGNRMCDICRRKLAYSEANKMPIIPSLGIVRMGIWVIDPLRPSTRPARSYIVDKSVYI